MTAGVVTVGGKKYAVGLYWEVSDGANATKVARQAAMQPGATADFYCVRAGNNKGRAAQFGLGETKLGHAWNMPTAAATLANRQPGSWAGVFVVSEGVWFVEVRDDLIAPEGDVLFADEAEAMTRLQEASARGGLERIYAPPSWAIPGAESSSLPSLLSGKADVRLRPVKLPKKVVMGAVAVAVGLVALLGVTVIVMNLQEAARQEEEARLAQQRAEDFRRQAEERARREEEERQRLLQQQAMQMPTYQRVWEQAPAPLSWIRACRDAMDKVQYQPVGWTLSSLTCSGKQVQAVWNRKAGEVAGVPEHAQINDNMQSASATFELTDLKARGPQQLWPGEAVNRYILRNDWTASFAYMPDEVPPALPNGQKVPPPPWVKRSIQWTVQLSPWTLQGPLVDLSGLVLDSLTWSESGSWAIKGVLYEQRK